MTGLTELWLPILLSSVFVFVASSIIHMAPLWHKNDYPKIPDEDKVRAALGPLGIPPGDYMVPRCASFKDMGTPEFQEKIKQGPVMVVTVMRNEMTPMARNLSLWFVFVVVVSVLAAYIAGRALPHGAHYLTVFRFAGATAFIGYSAALWPASIWYQRAWSFAIKETFDGLIYGLLTAGTFGWLWPR